LFYTFCCWLSDKFTADPDGALFASTEFTVINATTEQVMMAHTIPKIPLLDYGKHMPLSARCHLFGQFMEKNTCFYVRGDLNQLLY
jgi:hypothetical protein